MEEEGDEEEKEKNGEWRRCKERRIDFRFGKDDPKSREEIQKCFVFSAQNCSTQEVDPPNIIGKQKGCRL